MKAKILNLFDKGIKHKDWNWALSLIEKMPNKQDIYRSLLINLNKIEKNMKDNVELSEWFNIRNKIRIIKRKMG